MLSPSRLAVLVGFVVTTIAIAPGDVHAGGFIRAPTFTSPPVCGSLSLCSTDGDCTTGMTCANFGAVGAYCADTGQDLFCCDSGTACPMVDGLATTCVAVATDAGAISLCLPPDPRVCASGTGGMITWAQVETCYRSAVAADAHVYDWERGDCDGDGIANGSDTAPCVAAMADAGPLRDASARDVQSPVDAFGDARDVSETDVASFTDAVSDARSNDAGHEADGDSQQPIGEIPAVSFRGGGCRCAITRPTDSSGLARLALLAIVVALARHRRRTNGR
jgi:MYXO-CTERM domain-containing protein